MALPFKNEFAGMEREPVSLAQLNEARIRLRSDLIEALTANHKRFLLDSWQGIHLGTQCLSAPGRTASDPMEATEFGEAEETERHEISVSDRRAEKEIGA